MQADHWSHLSGQSLVLLAGLRGTERPLSVGVVGMEGPAGWGPGESWKQPNEDPGVNSCQGGEAGVRAGGEVQSGGLEW